MFCLTIINSLIVSLLNLVLRWETINAIALKDLSTDTWVEGIDRTTCDSLYSSGSENRFNSQYCRILIFFSFVYFTRSSSDSFMNSPFKLKLTVMSSTSWRLPPPILFSRRRNSSGVAWAVIADLLVSLELFGMNMLFGMNELFEMVVLFEMIVLTKKQDKTG